MKEVCHSFCQFQTEEGTSEKAISVETIKIETPSLKLWSGSQIYVDLNTVVGLLSKQCLLLWAF